MNVRFHGSRITHLQIYAIQQRFLGELLSWLLWVDFTTSCSRKENSRGSNLIAVTLWWYWLGNINPTGWMLGDLEGVDVVVLRSQSAEVGETQSWIWIWLFTLPSHGFVSLNTHRKGIWFTLYWYLLSSSDIVFCLFFYFFYFYFILNHDTQFSWLKSK